MDNIVRIQGNMVRIQYNTATKETDHMVVICKIWMKLLSNEYSSPYNCEGICPHCDICDIITDDLDETLQHHIQCRWSCK